MGPSWHRAWESASGTRYMWFSCSPVFERCHTICIFPTFSWFGVGFWKWLEPWGPWCRVPVLPNCYVKTSYQCLYRRALWLMEMTAKPLYFRRGYYSCIKAQGAEDQEDRSLRWLLWGSETHTLGIELSSSCMTVLWLRLAKPTTQLTDPAFTPCCWSPTWCHSKGGCGWRQPGVGAGEGALWQLVRLFFFLDAFHLSHWCSARVLDAFAKAVLLEFVQAQKREIWLF